MENTDHLDLIARYLHGELSPEGVQQFESLRSNDPDFAEEVVMAEILFADAKVKQKAEWQKWIDDPDDNGDHASVESGPRPKLPIPIWLLSLLLAVAFGVGFWIFSERPSFQQKVSEHLIAIECPFSQTMGAKPAQDLSWKDAIGDCQNANHFEVVRSLTPQIGSGETTPRVLLLATYCHLRIGNFSQANELSKQLISMDGHRHTETAYWYLAIGQILNGEESEARNALNVIISDKMKDWQVAEKWLEELQ